MTLTEKLREFYAGLIDSQRHTLTWYDSNAIRTADLPPDLLAEIERMEKDAARFNKLCNFIGAQRTTYGVAQFTYPLLVDYACFHDLMRGSIAEHFVNAIDAIAGKEARKP